MHTLTVLLAIASAAPGAAGDAPVNAAPPPSYVETLKREAPALLATVETPWVREVFARVAELPPRAPVVIYRDKARELWLSEAAFAKLPAAEQTKFTKDVWYDDKYYAKWSTPLAYARLLDLAAKHGKLDGIAKKKVVDFGYGDIGQLHLFARAGANAVGVDPHPSLPLVYARADDVGKQGTGAGAGTVSLVHDRWPETESALKGVGGDVDVFISKNTLKKGYVHPQKPVDKKKTLGLDIDDATFLARLHQALKPGGLVVIYNLAPAPSKGDEPYKHWAEGQCPFTKEELAKAGFDVVALDINDDACARKMARALGWDKGEEATDVDNDLFAWLTVLRRR